MSTDDLAIDICICTFRRPSVAETLRSLTRLALKPEWKIHVIVADNDETSSAKELVENTARECSLALTYLHAPARNISVARNTCLEAATAPLLAFIDDDEIATPAWLRSLIIALEDTGADAVLGPVQAIYGPACAPWMQQGDFHSIKPVWVNGEIITGYTSNVLLRRTAKAFEGLRFRKDLGRTGGEDTLFFSALHRAGGKIDYAPDAVVTETVTPERACLGWLMKRSFRSGQTHGLLLLENSGYGLLTRIGNIVIASAKSGFCVIALLVSFRRLTNMGRTDRPRNWLLRSAMHAGVVARLLGKQELEQYGLGS